MMEELLFSYGTLRQREVQVTLFGRELTGRDDAVVGFELHDALITDAAVVAVSGSDRHPILRPATGGNPEAAVDGTVFELTHTELLAADAYEVSEYERRMVALRSGGRAWAYVWAG